MGLKPICCKHKVSAAYDLESLVKLPIEEQSLAIENMKYNYRSESCSECGCALTVLALKGIYSIAPTE